jgi:acylphosphatase
VGWTKNEHDGSVTIFAQGDPAQLKKLVDWAHEGSPMSTVEKVDVQTTAPEEGLKGFSVK